MNANKSSIYMEIVQKYLVSKRDDVLSEFLGKKKKELRGVFAPKLADELEEERYAEIMDSRFFLGLDDVSTLNTYCAALESKLALETGMSREQSTHSRSLAIGRYVRSPCNGHREVITLLEELRAATSSDNANQDASLEAIVETVVLCVFETDAAWFVLAFLLRPDVIATFAQRTTASVLNKIAARMHKDSVVTVLSILLSEQRRGAIKTMLHKNIVRMLGNAKTPAASDLLLKEWAHRAKHNMHPSVRTEFINNALKAIVDSDADAAAMGWNVLEDLVVSKDASTTDLALLFQAAYFPFPESREKLAVIGGQRFESLFKHLAHEANRETMKQNEFAQLANTALTNQPIGTHIADLGTLKRYHGMMQMLLDAKHGNKAVVFFAEAMVLCFSVELDAAENSMPSADMLDRLRPRLLEPPPREGPAPATLAEMFAEDESMQPEEKYMTSLYADLYVGLVKLPMVQAWSGYPVAKRRDGSAAKELAKESSGVAHLRATAQSLLATLLHTPPVQHRRIAHLCGALQAISGAVSDRVATGPSEGPVTWSEVIFGGMLTKELECLSRAKAEYPSQTMILGLC